MNQLGIKTFVVVAVPDGIIEFVGTEKLETNSQMLVDIYRTFGKEF